MIDARLQTLRDAIELGEADVAAGRVTVLRNDEEVRAFFDGIEAELDADAVVGVSEQE